MHIDVSDETLSQTFCFKIEFSKLWMFHFSVCDQLAWFSKINLVFYFRDFMHIDARDKTLSQSFCFIKGYTPYFYQHAKKLGTVRDGPGSYGQKPLTRTPYQWAFGHYLTSKVAEIFRKLPKNIGYFESATFDIGQFRHRSFLDHWTVKSMVFESDQQYVNFLSI